MRSKKPILIVTFLFIWIFITYLIWHRQNVMEVDDYYKDIKTKLIELEYGIHEESQMHDILIEKLLIAIQHKRRPTSTEKLFEEQNLIVNGLVKTFTVSSASASSPTKSLIKNPKQNDNNIEKNLIQEDTNNNDQINSEQMLLTTTLKSDNDNINFSGPIIPVLVFACNRVSIRKCLDNLIEYRPNIKQFPIIVSLDCSDEPTRSIIKSYKDIKLIEQPDQSDISVPPREKKFKGYYKIARHYGWALNATFNQGYEYVIIVEDDLNVAPDFYEYFLGTHELLKNDSTLWCISAWNDNGKLENIDESQPNLLYRTDFFPGLGWMLTKQLWTELSVKWPKAFWDDWIRQPQQRKNRACIRPEISRTRTFGKVGVSNGLFFDKHLRHIKLSQQFVPFTKMNLTYLLQKNYDNEFINLVYTSPLVTFDELRRNMVTTKKPVRIPYYTKIQYKRTAKQLGLMDDFKSGVPRTGYHGIISFFYNNQRVYLAPNINWKGYDLTWS